MLDELRARVRPLTDAIHPDTPTGRSARFEPEYEAITAEVTRLDSPSGGAVDWARVSEMGERVLTTASKDLLVAGYFAYSRFEQKGLGGLTEGMVVVSDLMEAYWPSLFPEAQRLKARVNALTWLLERAAMGVMATSVMPAEAPALEALAAATRRLSEVARQKLEGNAPAFGPLLEAIERKRLALAEAAPSPRPPPVVAAPAAAPAPVTATAPSASSPVVTSNADAPAETIRQAGAALATAAAQLRRANPRDPNAYRLLRAGLWLHLTQAPPNGPQGRTSVPPLPAPLRQKLEQMSAHGRWEALLEESESALQTHRFQLDLHAFTQRALAALGPDFRAARESLIAEVRAGLGRLGGLEGLLASDGSPLADVATRQWLQEEVMAGGAPPSTSEMARPVPRTDLPSPVEDVLEAARARIRQGGWGDAAAAIQSQVELSPSSRTRFQLRLGLAQLAAAHGQPALARSLYCSLDSEAVAHGLDAWEPELAVECLEGLLRLQRAQKPGAPLGVEWGGHLQRLVRLSPAAALRIESGVS